MTGLSCTERQGQNGGQLSVVVWGTYDIGKPRVRILLQAARDSGIPLRQIHVNIWHGVEDKSQIKGSWRRLGYLLRWLGAYPVLIARYLFTARHDLVFVPYMGHLDVIVLRLFARLRGVPVVWDALLSLHGTLVEDRAVLAEGSLAERAVERLDRLAFACADQLITGTRARAQQYRRAYRVEETRITPIFVAAELSHFKPVTAFGSPQTAGKQRPLVLFYGQFSPLHGLPTVLEAAASEAGRQWDWLFVGTGQEGWRIASWIEREAPQHVQWLDWIPYEQLAATIQRADLCLGTFGASQKASTGISNKVFQILACGRPLATADTPAIRELVTPGMPGVYLLPAEDPEALAGLLGDLRHSLTSLRTGHFHQQVLQKLQPEALAAQLAAVFNRAVQAQLKDKVIL